MPADQQLATETTGSFESLLAVRGEHLELMRAVRRESRDEDLVPRVRTFVKRTEATGTLIDSPVDRDAAQGILDYWSAWLFTSADRAELSAAPPVLAAFDPSNAPDLSQAKNPYHGLSAYSEEDAAHFVGREEAVKTLLDKLRKQPVVLVIGPLGSGKTSLVLAGAVPRLKSRLVIENKDPVFPVVMPGTDPFASLLRGIYQAAADPALPELSAWIAEHKKKLEQSPAHLRALLDTIFPSRPVIIVVDQFEEVFTLSSDPKQRDRFTEAVVGIAPDAQASNRAILIIREDYRQQALQLEALKRLAENPEARFSPLPLTAPELLRIIESSATTVGLKFDEGIVEDLAKEVVGDVGALPMLQFTLSKLWSQRERNRVTWDAYRRVGRPREALKWAAEAVFDTLSPEEKKSAEQIFLELVQPTIGEDFSRRRMRRDTLLRVDAPERVTRVVERYVEAGIIRQTQGMDPDDDRFEVAHEALVNNWPRLREWLQQEREKTKKKLQLIAAARRWQESNRLSGYLLTGSALKDAAPYRDASSGLKEFIAASEQLRKRRLQGGLALLTLVVILVAGITISWILQREARITELQNQFVANYQRGLAASQKELEASADALQQQQRKIDALQQQLRRPGFSVAIDTAETETVPRAVAQAYLPDKNVVDRVSPARQQTGFIWIGSEPQTNLQDVESRAPVLPLAVRTGGRYRATKNLVLRTDKPADGYVQTASLGVVPEGTVITATGLAFPYVRPSGVQYWLPVRVDPSDQPIVYFQFATASQANARQFSDKLQASGYRIPGVEGTELAKGLNEVRYYYPADRKAAEKLAADVAGTFRSLGYRLPSETKALDLTAKAGPRNYPGVLELWLDLPSSR